MIKTIAALGLLTASSALAAQGYGTPAPAPAPTTPRLDTAKPAKSNKDSGGQRKVNISKPAQRRRSRRSEGLAPKLRNTG